MVMIRLQPDSDMLPLLGCAIQGGGSVTKSGRKDSAKTRQQIIRNGDYHESSARDAFGFRYSHCHNAKCEGSQLSDRDSQPRPKAERLCVLVCSPLHKAECAVILAAYDKCKLICHKFNINTDWTAIRSHFFYK